MKEQITKQVVLFVIIVMTLILIGILSFCVASQISLYGMIAIGLYLVAIGSILIVGIMKIAQRLIVQPLDELIEKMIHVVSGNLDTEIMIDASPEFVKISEELNNIASNSLKATEQLSRVLDTLNSKTAVYEYKHDMMRVLVTSKIQEVLDLTEEEMITLLGDKNLFEQKIKLLEDQIVDEKKGIYQLDSSKERYVKLDIFSDESGDFGVIMDVTEDYLAQKKLEYERDYDMLTDMYNRRAFKRKMEELFDKNREHIKCAAMVAFDMDNLKTINDKYGHAGGDLAIQKMAEVFKGVNTPNKIGARLGGDEFIMYIYGEDSYEAIESYILEMKEHSHKSQIVVEEGIALEVRFSGGYAYSSDRNLSYIKSMRQADKALYIAKESGKAQFFRYEEVV
ncbi:MAG: GGDEF domain-containing protein [Eubacteriales bacterium]